MKLLFPFFLLVFLLLKCSIASQICPLNYYSPNEVDRICDETYEEDKFCKACHESCRTCSGPNIDDCLTCETGSASRKIFNNIPNGIDWLLSYASQPFEAESTAEFGSRITFDGTARKLKYFTVVMVNWARYNHYNVGGDLYGTGEWAGEGFTHPLTLNIYEAGTGETPGTLLNTVTQRKFIK
jgi:hypothetical protein